LVEDTVQLITRSCWRLASRREVINVQILPASMFTLFSISFWK
jgi:hypothetical protein